MEDIVGNAMVRAEGHQTQARRRHGNSFSPGLFDTEEATLFARSDMDLDPDNMVRVVHWPVVIGPGLLLSVRHVTEAPQGVDGFVQALDRYEEVEIPLHA